MRICTHAPFAARGPKRIMGVRPGAVNPVSPKLRQLGRRLPPRGTESASARGAAVAQCSAGGTDCLQPSAKGGDQSHTRGRESE